MSLNGSCLSWRQPESCLPGHLSCHVSRCFVKDSSFNCQLLDWSRNKLTTAACPTTFAQLNFCWCNCYEYYIQTKWCIAASINVGLLENRQLVWVLPLRPISGEYNTQWFMLFFHVWITAIASAVTAVEKRRKKEVRKKSDNRQFARFGDLLICYFSNAFQRS